MNDQAILERILARRSAGVTEITHSQEIAETVASEIAEILTSPAQEVTKLPEVHDPAGEVLPFHVASGQATQVLGSVAIDPARMPDTSDPTVTDSKLRALPTRSAMARIRDRDAGVSEIAELIQASKIGKLAHKWGARVHVTVRVSR